MGTLSARRNPLDLDAAAWHVARNNLEAELLAIAEAGQGALGNGSDPAALHVAWLGPWPADDPVVRNTVDRTRRALASGTWLLGSPDEPAGSVTATLWLVRALAATGRWEEANLTMEAVVALAGPLGLLPEWVDPVAGSARGQRPWMAAQVTFLEAASELAAGPE